MHPHPEPGDNSGVCFPRTRQPLRNLFQLNPHEGVVGKGPSAGSCCATSRSTPPPYGDRNCQSWWGTSGTRRRAGRISHLVKPTVLTQGILLHCSFPVFCLLKWANSLLLCLNLFLFLFLLFSISNSFSNFNLLQILVSAARPSCLAPPPPKAREHSSPNL